MHSRMMTTWIFALVITAAATLPASSPKIFMIPSAEIPMTPPLTPEILNTPATGDLGEDRYVQLCYHRDFGLWVAVWDSNEDLDGRTGTDYDIYYAFSADDGETWSNPALVNTNGETDSGDDVRPVIAENNGFLLVLWESHENLDGAGTDLDILYTRTADWNNAFGFVAPRVVNTNASSDSGDDRNVRIVAVKGDEAIAVWESEENLNGTAGTDWDIFWAYFSMGWDPDPPYDPDPSLDSWTDPQLLDATATTDTGDDLNPDIDMDGRNKSWVVVWDRADDPDDGPDRDIYISTSPATIDWSAPVVLNTYGETDTAVDERPRIRANTTYNEEFHPWVVTWASTDTLGGTVAANYHILVATSMDYGSTWSDPTALVTTTKDSRTEFEARNPSLDCSTVGKWCLIAWEQENVNDPTGGDKDIFCSMASGYMTEWSEPERVAGNATTDTGEDRLPSVRAYKDRMWMIAWHSTEDLSGSGSADKDLFIVRRARIFTSDFERRTTDHWSETVSGSD